MTPDESWRPVVGFEGYYEVSDLGRVRSLTRRVPSGRGRTRIATGRVLSPSTGDPYRKVNMKVDGVQAMRSVHRLVALAFLGHCPDGMEVCHINGDHKDNRLANLRYDTHSENQRDTVRLGGHHYAKRTHCGKGHEFTPENTGWRSDSPNARWCRTCDSERARRKRARKRAQLHGAEARD